MDSDSVEFLFIIFPSGHIPPSPFPILGGEWGDSVVLLTVCALRELQVACCVVCGQSVAAAVM